MIDKASPSQRAQRIKPSPTIAISAHAATLKAAGHDIVSLSAGEPDFNTPEHICAAAYQAIKEGQTRYTAVDGTPALKTAILAKFQRDNQLEYNKEQIIVSTGGKQVFYNMAMALINQGDEVIIPAPYWVSYPDIISLAHGQSVIVKTTSQHKFKITPSQLEAAITEKTRLFVLNSPSNPTGSTYSKQELTALGEVLMHYPNVLIITDDIYEPILWTQEKFCNIVMACPDLYDRTIVLNGVSKAYAMTGWRIGYAGGPAWLIRAMKKIQSQSTSNPCSIAQAAAVAALNGSQACISTMRDAFKSRHDYVYKRLAAIPGISVMPSDGTFYIFPDFSQVMQRFNYNDDSQLAQYFLEKGVAMVPGSAFGMSGHLRLSFATDMPSLTKALNKIEQSIQPK